MPPITPPCRGCAGNSLQPILDLGCVPLANALITADRLGEPEERFPLVLYFCPDCALVQIGENVTPERLFGHYFYASSFSDTMLAHARLLADRLTDERGLGPTSLVVEVASNDGYLLQHYRNRHIPVLGIEPARNIASIRFLNSICGSLAASPRR